MHRDGHACTRADIHPEMPNICTSFFYCHDTLAHPHTKNYHSNLFYLFSFGIRRKIYLAAAYGKIDLCREIKRQFDRMHLQLDVQISSVFMDVCAGKTITFEFSHQSTGALHTHTHMGSLIIALCTVCRVLTQSYCFWNIAQRLINPTGNVSMWNYVCDAIREEMIYWNGVKNGALLLLLSLAVVDKETQPVFIRHELIFSSHSRCVVSFVVGWLDGCKHACVFVCVCAVCFWFLMFHMQRHKLQIKWRLVHQNGMRSHTSQRSKLAPFLVCLSSLVKREHFAAIW